MTFFPFLHNIFLRVKDMEITHCCKIHTTIVHWIVNTFFQCDVIVADIVVIVHIVIQNTTTKYCVLYFEYLFGAFNQNQAWCSGTFHLVRYNVFSD